MAALIARNGIMTTKQDVAAALKAHAEKKDQKAHRIKTRTVLLTTELRVAFEMLKKWVYNIDGLSAGEVAASSLMEVEDQRVGWTALLIKFAGTHITFQPELRFEELHLSVNWMWDEEEQTILLKPAQDDFEVYDQSGKRRIGTLKADDLHLEIIRITNAQSI